jgi:hypothetical protein
LAAEEETNALGELGGAATLPTQHQRSALGNPSINESNELGDFDDLLTLEMEKVKHDQRLEINPRWRVERRNDRNPPGFAIYQRGKPVYIGYIGYYSRSQKPEGFPTYSQLAGRS